MVCMLGERERATMGLIEDGASSEQLRAEEQRLLALLLEMMNEGIALLKEAERFRVGPEADRARYLQLRTDYLQAHEQHLQVHEDFMRVHRELQRREH